MYKTPSYIKALSQPNGKTAPSRKVWSVDLEMVWVPYFTAQNVMDETKVPSEDLGAPLRLAKAKDGSVKFTQSGRPSLKVAPVLNSHITMVRENLVALLVNHTGSVLKAYPEQYKAQVEAAQKAGAPIHNQAQADIAAAIAAAMQPTVVEQAEAIVEAQPEPEAVTA